LNAFIMPYTHFRFISYEVPTILSNRFNLDPGAVGNAPQLPNINAANSLSADARIRVQRLLKVMTTAANYMTNNFNENNTCYIFAAPEFYFRPATVQANAAGKYHYSYTRTERNNIVATLREYIKNHAIFDDWLIFPGTIIYKSVRAQGKDIHYNESVRFWRWTTNNGASRCSTSTFKKVDVSDADGMVADAHDKPMRSKRNDADEINKHYFTWRRINIGVDICLEHAFHYRVAKKAFKNYTAVPAHAFNGPAPYTTVNLHLIMAGGMPLAITNEDVNGGQFREMHDYAPGAALPAQRSIAARVNGHVLRIDGLNRRNVSASQLFRVDGLTQNERELDLIDNPDGSTTERVTFPAINSLDNWYQGIANPITHITAGITTIAINNAHDAYMAAPNGVNANSWMPAQNIKIYPRTAV
ncbi:MAG: hypothetical protein AAF570_19080, partial [Bacteroidota bacterium]